MKRTLILFRHECRDFLRQPPLWILVVLPVIMSKMIITVMDEGASDMMLLPSWLLFAQVMVGIMMAAPNLLEEKEHRTLDSLLLTPLRFCQVVAAKGGAVLLFSLASQLAVYAVNRGVDSQTGMASVIMLAGGLLFVLTGLLIGLLMNSSKNATAVASAVMVLVFLTGTLYPALPEWRTGLLWLPGVVMVEALQSVLDQDILWSRIGLLAGWLLVGLGLVGWLVRKEERR